MHRGYYCERINVMKNYWLYVLKLEQEKFYIGITTRTPEIRFREHVKGVRPAYWTKKYKPLKIIDSKNLDLMTRERAESYENKVVRKYMKEKGYNSARGGDLTNEEDYAVFGNRLFTLWDWYTFKVVVVLIVVILLLTILYVIK